MKIKMLTINGEPFEIDVVNLTPHVIRLNDGREFPPSGSVARVSSDYSDISCRHIPGVPTMTAGFGDVTGLPEPANNVFYIVSGMVMSACPDRLDIMAPATGHKDAVRKDGQIVSVPGFIRNARPKRVL